MYFYYILLAIFLVFNCNQFQSNNTEKIIIDIEKGEIGHYSYEFWKEYGQASMTLKEDGKFLLLGKYDGCLMSYRKKMEEFFKYI